jgi:hypothetical protein
MPALLQFLESTLDEFQHVVTVVCTEGSNFLLGERFGSGAEIGKMVQCFILGAHEIKKDETGVAMNE